jgi:hypothetical protein
MAMMVSLLVFPLAAHAEDPACGYVTYTPNGRSGQDLLPLERCSRSSCWGIGHGPGHHENGVVGRVDFFLCVRWP